MSIANAVQKGSFIYVYYEKGRALFSKPVGGGKNDGLKGYTSGAINIQQGSFIYSYNEKGQSTGSTPAR